MRRPALTALVIASMLGCWMGMARRAAACSFAASPHRLDDAERLVDVTPPGRPEVVSVRIGRGVGNNGSEFNSCDDIGWLAITLAAPTDDRTPSDLLGYLWEVDGNVPAGLYAPAEAERADGGILHVRWIDGRDDAQEAFEFSLTVSAVDLAGNEGEPSAPVLVSDPGRTASASDSSESCAVLSRRPGIVGWVSLVALLAVGQRARQGRGRNPRQSRRS